MLVRVLCLILLALNLGAAAWLLTDHAAPVPAAPATDPGVPELRMVAVSPRRVPPANPRPAESASVHATPALPAVVGASARPVAEDACFTLGPFATEADAKAALQALAPHVARIRQRTEPAPQATSYWVYLPPAASRAAALAVAKQLVAKGVHAYYIVPTGATRNAISLGLFDDPVNARQHAAALRKLGFAARIANQASGTQAYWLDYAVPAHGAFAWTAWLPGRSDLQSKSVGCS